MGVVVGLDVFLAPLEAKRCDSIFVSMPAVLLAVCIHRLYGVTLGTLAGGAVGGALCGIE